MLSEERLAEIRERCEAATPGPWKRGIGNEYREVTTTRGLLLADSRDPHDGWFIAHARQDIPDLLDEIARLKRQIAEHVCTLPASISEALNMGDGSYKP